MSQLVYEIDDHDRIVAVGADWQAFADANGARSLDHTNLVGRSLFEFIADATVRQIYAAVIAKARGGRPVRFEFRCDAPAWRREFEMKVEASAPARVAFVSTLLRQSCRPAIRLFDTPTASEKWFVRMCSWCHAVADDAGDWQPLETAIARLGLMEQARHGGVTHGICPECIERMLGILSPAN